MTLPTACEEWVRAFEAEILGQPTSREDEARAAKHEQTCEICARERAVWKELAGKGDDPRDDAFVEGVLDAYDRSKVTRLSGARVGTFAACAAAAAAAALFLVVHRKPAPAPAPQASSAEIAEMKGTVTLDGAPAAAHANLRTSSIVSTSSGRACLSIEPHVRLCLDRDTEIEVADLTLATRRVDVRHGRVACSLDPQPSGSTFTVSTRAGSVTAIGTAFVVDAESNDAHVLHGIVVVRTGTGTGAAEVRLAQHERIDLTTRARSTSTEQDERGDQALLDLADPPLPAADELPIAAPTVAPAPAPTSSAPVASAADLLRTARTLRGERKLAEAAQAYRKLQASHPTSAEAHASYVSLGELQLGAHDARGALQSFDTYLATPGNLTQQARYGRIQALRALGRTAEKQSAVRSFITDYPTAEEAVELADEK